VKSASSAVASSVSVSTQLHDPSPLEVARLYLRGALVLGEIELRRLRHDPTELFTRAVQPVLWLVIFGQAMARVRAIPTGQIDYLTFITPGILAQSAMFIAIFYGLAVIWERDQGILQKLLTMPVPHTSVVTGKGFGAGVRALCQAIVVMALALLLGVHVHWGIINVVGSLLAVVVGAGLFATISLLAAVLLKTRERFMGFGQVITMPLFFASNAIYPVSIMPTWLHVLTRVNPLSYLVDLLRGYLIGTHTWPLTLDWVVLFGCLIVTQVLAGQLFDQLMS